jgi:lipopolysaccharide transport system ATP-binding protein
MKPVVQINSISKQYRLGSTQSASYQTLREAVQDAVVSGWRKLVGPRRGEQPAGGAAGPATIWALRDVSFDVYPGEVVGIIGRNGAGKSTLLKILSRVTEPTSGEVTLRGRVASQLEVGTGFHPELTGRENVYLNGAILGMTRREIARKFDEIVDFAGIERFLDTPVKRYSSGMYMRLAFAVAAHLEPEILIIDEVLAVGDLEFQAKCLGKLGSAARSGRTVLFVSHNLPAVQNLCAKAVLLSSGQVECVGNCADVVAAYLQSVARVGPERPPLSTFRARGMMQVIQAVVLRDDAGQDTDRFCTGGGLTVEIEYDSPVPLTNPVFGVFFQRLSGEPLFHLQTLSQLGPLGSLPSRGVVRCRLPMLPLVPGTYVLSFNCSMMHMPGNLDHLDRAELIHVEAADFFGTGRLPPSHNGCFLLKADWDFLPAPPDRLDRTTNRADLPEEGDRAPAPLACH